jgi:hypothetical protein
MTYYNLPDQKQLIREGVSDPEIITDIHSMMITRDRSVIIRDEKHSKKGDYVIPDSVRIIWQGAFYDNKDLTSVTFPESLEKIDSSAFRYCTGLTSVIIPKSVVEINYYAFEGCTGLTSVTILNPEIKLGYYAFAKCTSLKNVNIEKKVKYKREQVFYGCELLPQYIEEKNIILKKEKIKKIEKKTAEDWIEVIMNESDYPYWIDRLTTKTVLKVKMTDKMLLEISVFNKQFQTIIPKIPDTIKQFDAIINESGINAYLYTIPMYGVYWKNPKKKNSK